MTKNKKTIKLSSIDLCSGCAACASICPTKSIAMREDREGFLQPKIDTNTCIKCHKCENTCPVIAPIAIHNEYETQAYAAINKDEDVRMRSSSGGVFYALAKWAIEQDGVVFSARFDENWDVVHDYTESIFGIEPFMRSKYVQSQIGDTFKHAESFLKEGRLVLFVGTPCQIGGLKSYLHKEYNNLLTVDFICHGVPSPGVWKRYLCEKVKGDTVLGINFRDKAVGWKQFQSITTTTTTTTHEAQMENLYFRGFLKNIYLRKSCYNCQFKQAHRISDITMGDYWGVELNCPEMDDNKGTSAALIHTDKGGQILQQLSEKLIIKKQTIEAIVKHNTMLTQSVGKNSKRKYFFILYPVLSFEKLRYIIDYNSVTDCCVNIAKKVVRKVTKLIK